MQPRNTSEERARVAALVGEVGPAEAARRTGHPLGTVKSWARRAGVVAPEPNPAKATAAASIAWAERRATLVDELGKAAAKAIDRVNERLEEDKTTGLRDLAVSAAVMIDKAQLLSGGSTARTETAVTREQMLEEARDRASRLRVA
jgi:hypothetical protein